MAALSELKTQRDTILAEMSKAQQVTFSDGRSVTHRPQSDLERALHRIDAEIARTEGTPGGSVFQVTTGRGLA